MQIEITRPTFLSGTAAAIGDVFDVDDQIARQTVALGKARYVTGAAEHIVAPPKPKVTKVSKAKADE